MSLSDVYDEVLTHTGADPGGGGPGVQDPPPPFRGTPKLHKEGKKRCARAPENATF